MESRLIQSPRYLPRFPPFQLFLKKGAARPTASFAKLKFLVAIRTLKTNQTGQDWISLTSSASVFPVLELIAYSFLSPGHGFLTMG